jgi:hypothetical protein
MGPPQFDPHLRHQRIFNKISCWHTNREGNPGQCRGKLEARGLNLYRRHRLDCEGGREFRSRSGEFEERKKSWRKCSCLIFASTIVQASDAFVASCTNRGIAIPHAR